MYFTSFHDLRLGQRSWEALWILPQQCISSFPSNITWFMEGGVSGMKIPKILEVKHGPKDVFQFLKSTMVSAGMSSIVVGHY